jgi:fructose-bisphosphate aldolase class II
MKTDSPATLLRKARRGKYAIGAFNVSSFAVLKAIVQAAEKLRSPVIIETSSGETTYMGESVQVALMGGFRRMTHVPLLLNLDHAKTALNVERAMRAGYDMVHFDGSSIPRERNIATLRRIVPRAHRRGILVEGECDRIAGSSEPHRRTRAETERHRGETTDPDVAEDFVRRTGVDIFASSIGNVHGVFSTRERLDFPLLRELARRLPSYLSLHGGSGIERKHIRRAIAAGITKINVNTDLRIAYMTALRRALARNRSVVVPYRLMPPVIAAVQKVVEEKIKLFGSAGKA